MVDLTQPARADGSSPAAIFQQDVGSDSFESESGSEIVDKLIAGNVTVFHNGRRIPYNLVIEERVQNVCCRQS